MSADPAPSAPSGAIATIMMVAGIILVLPGICSLVAMGLLIPSGGLRVFYDPYTRDFAVFWGISGLIAWGGIAMIRAARRRFAARAAARNP